MRSWDRERPLSPLNFWWRTYFCAIPPTLSLLTLSSRYGLSYLPIHCSLPGIGIRGNRISPPNAYPHETPTRARRFDATDFEWRVYLATRNRIHPVGEGLRFEGNQEMHSRVAMSVEAYSVVALGI